MSQQQQATTYFSWAEACGYLHLGDSGWPWAGIRVGRNLKLLLFFVASGQLIEVGATSLERFSDNKSQSQSAQVQAAQPAFNSQMLASQEPAQPTTNNAATAATRQPSRVGSRYRVVVETAYFYDAPQQSTPSGRYLRRGDVLYGEEEANGFVKSSFVQPNGATGFGWLKSQELSRLANLPTPKASPATRPRSAAAQPQLLGSRGNAEVVTPGRPLGTSPAKTAVVRVSRSYFYNSPDLEKPRRAYCEQGDKVRLGESRGDAVFVSFTNWEKVTTTGWMRKDALRFNL